MTESLTMTERRKYRDK